MKITQGKYFAIKQILGFNIYTHKEIAEIYACSTKTVQRVASTRRYAQYLEMRRIPKVDKKYVKEIKRHDTDTLILTWVLIYAFALLQIISFFI